MELIRIPGLVDEVDDCCDQLISNYHGLLFLIREDLWWFLLSPFVLYRSFAHIVQWHIKNRYCQRALLKSKDSKGGKPLCTYLTEHFLAGRKCGMIVILHRKDCGLDCFSLWSTVPHNSGISFIVKPQSVDILQIDKAPKSNPLSH